MIPLLIPYFEGNERKYVEDAVNQGWVSTGGKYIGIMEEKLALFLNVKEVAACQSGTSAIHLSLIDAGIEPGDMVKINRDCVKVSLRSIIARIEENRNEVKSVLEKYRNFN